MKVSTIEKFKDRLFDDLDKLDATEKEKKQILIYRYLLTLRLEKPYVTNAQLAKSLKSHFDVSSVGQAYRYIGHVELLVGNIRSSEKAWIRYTVVETLKEAIQRAKAADDIKAMVAAADKLGKYTRLDKEDQEPLPWEEIKPQPVEFVTDPSVLGIEHVENPRALVEKVRKKYMDEIEVEYTEAKS